MPDIEPATLRPATDEELKWALSFALRFRGRKRVNHADDFMASLAADTLIQHLKRSGFVVMKKPDAPDPDASAHYPLKE